MNPAFDENNVKNKLKEYVEQTLPETLNEGKISIRKVTVDFSSSDFIEIKIEVSPNTSDENIDEDIEFICSRTRQAVISYFGSNLKDYQKNSIRIVIVNQTNNNEVFETTLGLTQTVFLKSSDLVWIFQSKINVLMEEYKTIRQELIGNATLANNIFNYALIALTFTFAATQAILSQLNDLVKYSENFNDAMFDSLRLLLFILLHFFIPFICFVFILKWISNIRSTAFLGSYLTRIELEVNRAFERFKNSNTNIPAFADYELQLGWETNLRRVRRSMNNPYIRFGGIHMNLVILFLFLIGLGTQFLSTIMIGKQTYPMMWFIGVIGLICGIGTVVYQWAVTEEWFLASTNSKIASLRESGLMSLKIIIIHIGILFIFILLFILSESMMKRIFIVIFYLVLELLCFLFVNNGNFKQYLKQNFQPSLKQTRKHLLRLIVAFVMIALLCLNSTSQEAYSNNAKQELIKEKIVNQFSKKILEIIAQDNENNLILTGLTKSSFSEIEKKLSNQKDTKAKEAKQSIINFLINYDLLSCDNDKKLCVNLQNFDLSNIDLSGANLSGANLSGANLSGVKLPISGNLTKKQLTDACYWSKISNFSDIATDSRFRLIQSDDKSDENGCKKWKNS